MKTQVYTDSDALTIECEKGDENVWFDITQDVLTEPWQAFLNANFPNRAELSIDVHYVVETAYEARSWDCPGGITTDYAIKKVNICIPGAMGRVLMTITPKTHKSLMDDLDSRVIATIK